MQGERRFWLWYAAAWLPLCAFYFFAFYLEGRMAVGGTALAALVNVLPEAALGVLVVHAGRRLWRSERRARRLAILVGLALAFALAVTAAKAALNILLLRMDGRAADWATYDRRILVWQVFFSLLSFTVLTSVTFALAAAARLHEAESRRSQAELLRTRSELKALRAQLNPHFLFNALHTVTALIRSNPEAAEAALEQLGDLLRHALRVQDAADEGVLLGEEWAFVRAYLALETLRMGERLRVDEQVSDAALSCVVPAFVLQPLVENAIRHGIGPRERGGTLWLRAEVADGVLCLEVRDDGQGTGGAATRGTGRGLELVRQRVRVLHGDAGSVQVVSAPGAGFAVTLRLPAPRDAG